MGRRTLAMFPRCLAGLVFIVAGCTGSAEDHGATPDKQDGAVDAPAGDDRAVVDESDAHEPSGDAMDAADSETSDARDTRDTNLPPRCLGVHAVCHRYDSDNPTPCLDHGCVWSGSCSGTPHPCTSLGQSVCNSHEGCAWQ
jgi:hypothetical protein